MYIDFNGKTALVTGGTRGIGKSIVTLLIDAGCNVIYTGTQKKPDITIENASYKQLDLSDKKSITHFIKNVLNDIKKIDILINNAGINIIESIDKLDEKNWQKVLDVNLTGPMLLTREVSKKMKKNNKGGKILNVSSIFGIVSKAKRDSYSASKFGLIGLTRASALELAPYNILVNALCPGFTSTELTMSILSKEEIKLLQKQIPMGRFAEAEEIAKAAIFLCSDLNSYITGQTLIVDGGFVSK
jgi:3-oxoacyl-[acyl-carrier protein] reductase